MVASQDEYFVVGSLITVIPPPNTLQAHTRQAKELPNPLPWLRSIKTGRFYGWYPRDLPDILFWICLFFCFPLFVNWSERHDKAMLAFTFVLNFFQTQPWQNFSLGKVLALAKFYLQLDSGRSYFFSLSFPIWHHFLIWTLWETQWPDI